MERNPTTVPYMLSKFTGETTGHSPLKGFHCVNPHFTHTAAAGLVPDLRSDTAIVGLKLFKDHYNESGHVKQQVYMYVSVFACFKVTVYDI